ncbi:hypothetical protein SLA2020_383030 [Shorea laevis]
MSNKWSRRKLYSREDLNLDYVAAVVDQLDDDLLRGDAISSQSCRNGLCNCLAHIILSLCRLGQLLLHQSHLLALPFSLFMLFCYKLILVCLFLGKVRYHHHCHQVILGLSLLLSKSNILWIYLGANPWHETGQATFNSLNPCLVIHGWP